MLFFKLLGVVLVPVAAVLFFASFLSICGISGTLVFPLSILLVIWMLLKKKKEFGKKWKKSEVAIVYIQDKELHCSHCGYNRFSKRQGLITTSWVSLFQLTYLNKSARCFSCTHCGFLHWFVDTTETVKIVSVEKTFPTCDCKEIKE